MFHVAILNCRELGIELRFQWGPEAFTGRVGIVFGGGDAVVLDLSVVIILDHGDVVVQDAVFGVVLFFIGVKGHVACVSFMPALFFIAHLIHQRQGPLLCQNSCFSGNSGFRPDLNVNLVDVGSHFLIKGPVYRRHMPASLFAARLAY